MIENYNEKLDINSKNSDGKTVLHSAAFWGYSEIVNYFLKKNYKGNLYIIGKSSDVHINREILQILVENYREKIDINSKNIEGDSTAPPVEPPTEEQPS